jgi:hypothetical protein
MSNKNKDEKEPKNIKKPINSNCARDTYDTDFITYIEKETK